MSTINAKLIEQLDLIEPEFTQTEEQFKLASNSVKKDQFRIDKLNAKTVAIRAGKTMLRIKNTAQNLEFYRSALKYAHRTYPAGTWKRQGVGRSFPKFEPGMKTLEYILKYCAMNDQMGLPPIDFDALGHRPAATYENGALDFEVIEETNEDYLEAQAAQDVAQVVAQAVAAVAISEAMQPSEADAELVTCEAGESEAHVVTVGSVSGATWAPVPQYAPCPPNKTGLGDGPAPAFRGTDGDTPTTPPAEFLGDATPRVAVSGGSYATDGKCHNAQNGTYGHECGKPAQWIGTTSSGFQCGFCDSCKTSGHEARKVVKWSPIGNAPTPPVVETEATPEQARKAQIDAEYAHLPEGNRPPAFIYGEGLETWQMDAGTFSKQSRDNPHWTRSYTGGDGDYLRDCFATHAAIVAAHEATQAQDVPALETPKGQQVIGKSGKWSAYLYTWHDGKPWMTFEATNGAYECNGYDNARERMKALQALAMAADAPTDTPPGGGLPCPEPVAVVEPVAGVAPTPPVAISSASPTPRVAVRRNFIPDNGLHIVEDSFEAWTFASGARFAFVMYLGKSAKPWKYYGYNTEAKRDDGFNRHAQEARSIALSKANRKAESKAQAEKPHGLQVGDVVRSSWGYDQTNVDHYQIVKVIGKRTVEVRKLVEHEESTGDMTGRLAPVHGEFVGEVMRRQVDSLGQVNILQASYGRASKIEPLAIVHGVRCYAATSYSSYA